MTTRPRHAGPAASLTPRRVSVAALVAGAVACLVVGVLEVTSPTTAAAPRAPVTSNAAVATVATPEPVATTPVRRPHVVPRRVAIPSIEVATPLVRLGLRPDGTVQVPADPARAGWFDLGTVPGEVGSAVVLGHVDSVDGPAVFARLSELSRGAVVVVALSDGSRARFRVQGVRTYANARFPAERVYRGRPGRRLLTLVTCGGAYDRDRGGYQSNVVVWARAT